MTTVRVTLTGCTPLFADAGLWLKAEPTELEPEAAKDVARRMAAVVPGARIETLEPDRPAHGGTGGAASGADTCVSFIGPANPAALRSRGDAGQGDSPSDVRSTQQNGLQAPMTGSGDQ